MSVDRHEGILRIDGDVGIGVGLNTPTMRIDIGEASDSIGIGVGNGPPHPLIPSPRCGEGWTRQRTE
jgi:hypothetical protein